MPLLRELLALAAAVIACGGPRANTAPGRILATGQDTTSIPAGYGTLRRDDIAVQLNASQLQVQVLPLAEDIIRLLRPDAYHALSSLIQSRRAAIAEAAGRAGVDPPTLMLVTFRGVVPQARFRPEELSIGNRGELFRPSGVVPLSTAWDTYQLEAREQAVAIYLFPEGISLREPLRVSYEGLVNDSWTRTLSVVQRERAAVLVRARTTPPADTTSPDLP